MRLKTLYTCILTILSIGFSNQLTAQTESKRELRATWVASVANIDWPLYEDRGKPEEQKADLISKLELYESIHINAIFLQVRPECDAFYQSAYEPWSRYLSWAQGDYPGYDPLRFAIDEAHKRGIEVHAWMNPYRLSASTSPGTGYFDPDHVYMEHPEWAIQYPSGRLILNPGIPEVMSYIGAVVRDLCSNYNVDGVHFDDYFYAYEGTDASLDATEYALYGSGMSLSNWRRDNVNRMIDTVYRNIKEVNPDIRFGVSPFGIYRPGIPSGIVGMDAYAQIYCDPLAWLEDGSIDYLTPQLYWPTGGGQDFETLANWWADRCTEYGRHLYAGHGSYRLSDNPATKKSFQEESLHERKAYFDSYVSEKGDILDLSLLESGDKKSTSDPVAAWTLSQLGLQIDIVRSRQNGSGLGSVFFSATDMERVSGLADYLSLNKYTHPSIVPEMSWIPGSAPQKPQNIRSEESGGNYYLTWDPAAGTNTRYAVYASETETDPALIISNPDNLKNIVFDPGIAFSDLDFSSGSTIIITSISAAGRESLPGDPYTLDVNLPLVDLLGPDNEVEVSQDEKLSWKCDEPGSLFKLEISGNITFSNKIYEGNWVSSKEQLLSALPLPGEKSFYWRVKAKTTMEGPWSETRKIITAWPAVPELVYPGNLELNVSTLPRLRWEASAAAQNISAEISTVNDFSSLVTSSLFPAADGEGKISTELQKQSWYYIRIKALNDAGESGYSTTHSFNTTSGEIPEVILVGPADNHTLSSEDYFVWESSTSAGSITYLMEVAADMQFSFIMSNTGWIPGEEVKASLLNIEGQRDYYWRVRAKSEYGTGDYSETRSFTTGYPTRPSVTSPLQLSEENDVKTTVSWNADAETDSVYLQFSEDGNFETIDYSESMLAAPNSGSISVSLKEYTWYFLRAAAKNEYGRGIFSASRYFKTGKSNNTGETETDALFSLYPNPFSSGVLSIQLNAKPEGIREISIYNSQGQVIYNESARGNLVQLNREIFSTQGIYMVTVLDENRLFKKSLLVIY